MDILVTLDEGYLMQLRVMLTSLYLNHPNELCRVYLLHSRIPDVRLRELGKGLRALGCELHPVRVDSRLFEKAPVTKQYPQEMYYRLLAARLLPEDLERVLYLDPDVLIINSLKPLWEVEMGDFLFAAASHTGKTEIANSVNRLRLGTDRNYYNSGVLLMELGNCRRAIVPEDVFRFVEDHAAELVLPDQDVLNAMYGSRILEIDDFRWNYDARNYTSYYMRSAGDANLEWVMRNHVDSAFLRKGKALERALQTSLWRFVPALYAACGAVSAVKIRLTGFCGRRSGDAR